jgi:hypothetical protein
MKDRFLVIAFATTGLTSLVSLSGACGGTGEPSRAAEDIGQATAALTAIPPMVGCVEIDVTGARSVTDRFDVTPSKPPVLSLTQLPLGSDTFVGLAYPSACAGVMSTTQSTWISNPVVATLTPQAVASISLALRPNGQASVGVGFVPDEAGASCMSPLVSCAGGCVDTTSDPNNCGACGVACSAGSMCLLGMCSTTVMMCPAGTTQCATGCVNLSTDSNNCGMCGNACPLAEHCAPKGTPPVGVCLCASCM